MTSLALLTDLYELTMAQAYFELDMHKTAVFELFVRKLPSTRRFLVAAGLEQIIELIESLRFTCEDIEFLSGLGLFRASFLRYLESVRFTGSVHAMREGTPFFADEPIVRVTGPILEAQLLESRILNIGHFQSLIASKAARCVLAAQGRRLVDFGLRRAHEADAGILAARAAFIAGFDATATVESGRRFGIPLSGTLAHSFIEAHDSEEQAFRSFLKASVGPTTLLVDTYDTERAVRRAIDIDRELARPDAPHPLQAIRIDSGDLAAQARSARAMLDAAGCEHIKIVLSGGLDEHSIADLVRTAVPADAFGVGTSLDTSSDAPALDMAYKLQEYAGKPRRKRSVGKATWPGAKQVFRQRDGSGRATLDRIALIEEGGEGDALLAEVLRDGRRLAPSPTLRDIQQLCRREVAALPAELHRLEEGASSFPVQISDAVRRLAASVDAAAL
jgi:nicotinate phosphoribosyltransferase